MKTNSGLSAYYHGNTDFPNVWEQCWPTRTIPYSKKDAEVICARKVVLFPNVLHVHHGQDHNPINTECSCLRHSHAEYKNKLMSYGAAK